MRHPIIWFLACLTLVACRYGEIMPMPGGGKPYGSDTGSTTVTPGDDTSGPPITDDTGPPVASGDAPTILNVTLSVEEYPDIGWIVEITVTYTDADQDVEGGNVLLDITLGDAATEHMTVPIDGSQAIHDEEDGTVFLALELPDENVTGSLTVFLQDANGHESDPYELTLN